MVKGIGVVHNELGVEFVKRVRVGAKVGEGVFLWYSRKYENLCPLAQRHFVEVDFVIRELTTNSYSLWIIFGLMITWTFTKC